MYNNLLRLAQEYQWYRNTNGTGVPMVILILYFNRHLYPRIQTKQRGLDLGPPALQANTVPLGWFNLNKLISNIHS